MEMNVKVIEDKMYRDLLDVKALYEDGCEPKDIAEFLNRSRSQINLWIVTFFMSEEEGRAIIDEWCEEYDWKNRRRKEP